MVTEPAIIIKIDIGFEDHGFFHINCEFDYGSSGQHLGYVGIDAEFIKKFLAVFNANYLQECKGKVVLVTHDNTHISKIEPMKFEKGEPFDLEEWSNSRK